MDDNVVYLSMTTRLDIPVSRVLESALDLDLESVVIMGYQKDGEAFYASSMASGSDVVWHIESLKKLLLDL